MVCLDIATFNKGYLLFRVSLPLSLFVSRQITHSMTQNKQQWGWSPMTSFFYKPSKITETFKVGLILYLNRLCVYFGMLPYLCMIVITGINYWCCNNWPWQAHRPKYSLHVDKLNISVRCIKVHWFHTPICYKVGTSQNNWLNHTIQRDKVQYFVFFKCPINSN